MFLSEESEAFGDVDGFGATTSTDARAANFFDGGTSLTPVAARAATSLTGAQIARDAQGQAAASLQAAAAKTATLNLAAKQAQAAEATRNQQLMNVLAANPVVSKARVDWGLLPAAAAVLTTGAALIASGGTLGAALAAPISAGGAAGAAAAVSTAVTADKLLATVERGGEVASAAKAVLDNTKALANAGSQNAKDAVKVIEQVASDRVAAAIPSGVTQQISAAAQTAYETVPSVLAVKDLVSSLKGGSLPAGAHPVGLPAGALPVGTIPALASAAAGAAPATRAATPSYFSATASDVVAQRPVATSSGVPRWVVTDFGAILPGAGQPVSARGRYLVFDGGRVVHQ